MDVNCCRRNQGFTLVELMIAVAIIGIIVGIGIPIYSGYMQNSQQQVAETNLGQLRLALENYYLDNDTYIAGSYAPGGGASTLATALNWRPDGDGDKFTYTVAPCGAGIATCYTITVTDGTVTATYTRP